MNKCIEQINEKYIFGYIFCPPSLVEVDEMNIERITVILNCCHVNVFPLIVYVEVNCNKQNQHSMAYITYYPRQRAFFSTTLLVECFTYNFAKGIVYSFCNGVTTSTVTVA